MATIQTAKTTQVKKKSAAEVLRERKIASLQEQITHAEETIAALETRRDAITKLDVVGLPVAHKTFGNGIIVEQNTSSITASFGLGDKRFIMPSAFIDGFLFTENAEINTVFSQYKEMGNQILHAKEDISAATKAIHFLEKK